MPNYSAAETTFTPNQNAARSTAHEYRTAFAEGRLKKRKRRGADAVKVWIERDSERA